MIVSAVWTWGSLVFIVRILSKVFLRGIARMMASVKTS